MINIFNKYNHADWCYYRKQYWHKKTRLFFSHSFITSFLVSFSVAIISHLEIIAYLDATATYSIATEFSSCGLYHAIHVLLDHRPVHPWRIAIHLSTKKVNLFFGRKDQFEILIPKMHFYLFLFQFYFLLFSLLFQCGHYLTLGDNCISGCDRLLSKSDKKTKKMPTGGGVCAWCACKKFFQEQQVQIHFDNLNAFQKNPEGWKNWFQRDSNTFKWTCS